MSNVRTWIVLAADPLKSEPFNEREGLQVVVNLQPLLDGQLCILCSEMLNLEYSLLPPHTALE